MDIQHNDKPLDEHDWFTARVATHITDGLDEADQSRFDEHARTCPACAAELAQATQNDAALRRMFEAELAAAGFEDRVIQNLRLKNPGPKWALRSPVKLHPMVKKAVVAAVAAMVLGGLGYEAEKLLWAGDSARFAAEHPGMAMLHNMEPTFAVAANINPGPTQAESFGGGTVTNLQPTVQDSKVLVRHLQRADSAAAVKVIQDIFAPPTKNNQNGVIGPAAIFGGGGGRGGGTFGGAFGAAGGAVGGGQDVGDTGKVAASADSQSNDVVVSGPVALVDLIDTQILSELDKDPFGNQIAGARPGSESSLPGVTVDLPTPTAPKYFQPADASGSPYDQIFIKGTSPMSVGGLVLTPDSGTASAGNKQGQQAGQSSSVGQYRGAFSGADSTSKLEAGTEIVGGIASESQEFDKDRQAWIAKAQGQEKLLAANDQDVTQRRFDTDSAMVTTPGQAVTIGGAVLQIADAGKAAEPPAGKPAPASGTAPAAPVPVNSTATLRKIIRHGEMSFEVDSFDSAYALVTRIAGEEGGFVATADSEKLANGKVSGMVEVRVPPEHLDTFVLKLRGLGDLKGQKIASDDVTKDYTDLESELRAATAMEDRLLDIIKTGKGEVKDLVEAEKELGTWREKAEKITGEINYYNNLIAYSTLQITLTERDLRQAAMASEQEKASMGIETEDVEKAREDALKTISDAKGRIVQSELKRFDAGQLDATIVAEISPDNAGPVIDHIKQLGHVSRLEINRDQTLPPGTTAIPGMHVQSLDTQIQISLYNLANVAPRETSTLSLACDDVESVYHVIEAKISDSGGRVVNSNLNRVKPQEISGTITCEAPEAKAEQVLGDIRSLGEVMHLSVTENSDTANVTSSKRGFAISLVSSTAVPPREVITETVLPAGGVSDGYHAILTAAQAAGALVQTAQLNEKNPSDTSATLVIEVPRKAQQQIDDALTKSAGETGGIIARQSNRSSDTEHTLDTRVQYLLSLLDKDHLPARLTTTTAVEVLDPQQAMTDLKAAALAAGGRVDDSSMRKDETYATHVVVEVPLSHSSDFVEKLKSAGEMKTIEQVKDPSVADSGAAKARFDVSFTATPLVPGGVWDTVKGGLGDSLRGLWMSASWLVMGVCVAAPWAVIVWIGWKVWKRSRRGVGTA